jgi:hypothetical protein
MEEGQDRKKPTTQCVCVQVIYPLGRAVGERAWNEPHKHRRKGRSRKVRIEQKGRGGRPTKPTTPHVINVCCVDRTDGARRMVQTSIRKRRHRQQLYAYTIER